MFQVRIHGRGGQGIVTAAELLAAAAFAEGHHAQAFPSFGSERTGAPVVAFCRISGQPIRLREPVLRPDLVIVADPTLLRQIDVFAGLVSGGTALVNSQRSWRQLRLDQDPAAPPPERIVIVPASQLALTHVGRPLPNAALLGGFAALTGLLSLESVTRAIRDRFGGRIGAGNVAAAAAAYRQVLATMEDWSHA